jgi:hypothetical protein
MNVALNPLGIRIKASLIRKHLITRHGEDSHVAKVLNNWSDEPPKFYESVTWCFWLAGYERSFHGTPAVIDLGELD